MDTDLEAIFEQTSGGRVTWMYGFCDRRGVKWVLKKSGDVDGSV